MTLGPVVQPLIGPPVRGPRHGIGLSSSAGFFAAMSDPAQPLPSFVEGWALNGFHGVAYPAPAAAGIPSDSMSQLQLEYTVSGAAGASSLTISAGDQTKGAGAWGAVIQHDDGTYGMYGITGLGGGVCSVYPNLRAAVTGKTLRNSGGTVNGQHFTEPAYRALARYVFGVTRSSAYRMRYAAKWAAATGAKSDWANTGGLGTGQYSLLTMNPEINNTANRANRALIARGRMAIAAAPTAPFTGKGLTKTFSLGGATGFLEMFASCASNSAGASGGFYPFRVQVVVDGVTLLDSTYTENHGLQRIVVAYTNGTTGTVTVTRADETGDTSVNLLVGDVTWWKYDRTPVGYAWTDSVIDKNAKTVVIGDSWTTFYPDGGSGVDGAFGSELQAAMTAAGGTGAVVSVGTAGTTAEFGLTEFDAKVAPESPTQVVILYFTNDHNAYGDTGYERWLRAMYRMGLKCQAIGARPIFVMPLPTQSQGQTYGHGIWSERIGAGLLP